MVKFKILTEFIRNLFLYVFNFRYLKNHRVQSKFLTFLAFIK